MTVGGLSEEDDGQLWITNNLNYAQFTFDANQTTYDFDFVDVVGQQISFWVQSMNTGERLVEQTMLMKPVEPNLSIACGTNCENNMVTVKWNGADYDNVTLIHYIDGENILLSREVFQNASSTFFTYQPGRLERFEGRGL